MMKVKSKSRLKILLGTTVILIMLVSGAWVARKYQVRRIYARYRTDGMAAAAAGRNQDALPLLEKYLGRYPSDVDAMVALAHAFQNVPLPKGANLVQSAYILRTALRLDPKRTELQHELLILYGKTGPAADAAALAEEVLKSNAYDLDALRIQAFALASLRNIDKGSIAARTWADADKTNPEAHLLVISFFIESNDSVGAVNYADELSAAEVGQQTKQVVQAIARLQTGHPDQASPLLLQVAAAHPKDKTTVFLVSNALEQLGLMKESLALLREAATSGDAEIRQRLLRHVWQSGDASGFVELVGTPVSTPETQWAEETALKMISLRRLQRIAEADAVENALKARPGELESAWMTASNELNGIAIDQATAAKLKDQCRAALSLDLDNPFLTESLANALRVTGDEDAALRLYQDLSIRNPGWLVPILRVTELQMSRGHIDEAFDAARLGLARAPQNVRMAAILVNVWDAAIDQKLRNDDAELLKFAERVQQASPGEELSLNAYIRRLCLVGRIDEAKTALDNTLNKTESHPDEGALLNWAATSFQFKLGLEDRCIDKSERAFGVTPQSALFRSSLMLSSGHPEEGLKWLRDNTPASDAAQKDNPAWRLAQARYLDRIQSADALPFWTKLCDDFSRNLEVQQAALLSPPVRQDRKLQERIIGNVELISGKENQLWKLSQSRLLVTGSFTEEDAQQAAVYLNEVLKSAPDLVEAKILLARCFEKLHNLPQAVEQVSAAARLRADLPLLTLYLGQLLQESGDYAGAKQQLDRLATTDIKDAEQRRSTAILLERQGDPAKAADLLQSTQGQSRDADLLLAQMYFQSNQSDRATAIAEKLMQSPDLAAVRMAADLYASMGRQEDAEKVLNRMDGMNVDPVDKMIIRSNFQMKHGNSSAAIDILRKAVVDAPAKPVPWRLLVSELLLESRTAEAISVASDGLKQIPGDAVLAGIVKRQVLIRATADRGMMPLAIGLVQSPDDPALVDAATLLTAADADSPSRAMVYCSQLGDRYPRELSVQLVIIDRCLLFHRPREAAALASRASQAFPFSPEPPKIAVQCYGEMKDWTQALAMAKIWRQRDAAHVMEADLTIANLLLSQQNQNDAAAAVLEPYVASAKEKPEASAVAVAKYALALCLAGKTDKAEASLQPLLSGGGPVFITWLQTAAASLPREQAEAWVERMTRSSDNSIATQMALARAEGLLATRFPDAQHKERAVALLHDLSNRPNLPTGAMLSVGISLETLGDVETAEQIYRKISPTDDSAGVARNNLAMILARRGDSAAAIQMAQSAVQSAPGRTYALDTLAFAQRKAKNLDSAATTLRQAIQIEPWSADLRISLTEVLIDAFKTQEAQKELATVEDMLGGVMSDTVKQKITTLHKSLDSKA